MDLDIWDIKSRFSEQTSAWCGMASMTGTGFFSEVSGSTCGDTNDFRLRDPNLKRHSSSSCLAPEASTPSLPTSPRPQLRAAQDAGSFGQMEMWQRLQDAHRHLDIQLDRLTTRNSELSANITATQLFDMKHRQLSEAMRALEQEKQGDEVSISEKSQQCGTLHEKILQLEKDVLQMRSALNRGSSDEPLKGIPDHLGRTLLMSHEHSSRQERQTAETELHQLREALRNAEARAKTQEEERCQALQKLQTSKEQQKVLLNQVEEMKQRLSQVKQSHSQVQEQLSEANNKISQACLEKAILSTQVLKLEDDLKAKWTGPGNDKGLLIKEKAGLHKAQVLPELQSKQQNSQACEPIQKIQKSKALTEVNETLARQLEMMKQKLDTAQCQLQEVTAKGVIERQQIADLEAERSQLMREKEELGKLKEDHHDELTETQEKCCQLRKSVDILELEKLTLQDQCQHLARKVHEKEEKLQGLEEEHWKQDAVRVQSTDDLKAMVGHWTEKWQKVALTLKSTQEELEELKRKEFHLATETEKIKAESQKDKQELEKLLQYNINMETKLTRAKVELDTCKEELELERSKNQELGHRYTDESTGGEASLWTQNKQTMTDGSSQSPLLWEPPSDSHSSQNKASQLEDEKPSVEFKKDKSVCPVSSSLQTEQQRRMVAEQLKDLFKERHGKDLEHADSTTALNVASSPQDRTPTPPAVKSAVDRSSWQQGSGLMPVFEEDEDEESSGAAEEVSALKEEVSGGLKAENEKLLQVTQKNHSPIQDCAPASDAVLEPVRGSDETDPPLDTALSLYPDGIFLAEPVNICSPDEDEDEC
ncbi:uncharacterized protein V6R79_007332 [Siganus canaliculatus]